MLKNTVGKLLANNMVKWGKQYSKTESIEYTVKKQILR